MSEQQPALRLGGYAEPEFTPIPDKFFDHDLAHLSCAETKVLLYLFRRTYGFKKQADAVSLNQICHGITRRDGVRLDEGTGLARSSVQGAIRGLTEKGCIEAIRNTSAERGYEATTYQVARTTTDQVPACADDRPSAESPIGLACIENRPIPVPKIGRALYRESVTQETVVQETEQETVNKSVGAAARACAPTLDIGREWAKRTGGKLGRESQNQGQQLFTEAANRGRATDFWTLMQEWADNHWRWETFTATVHEHLILGLPRRRDLAGRAGTLAPPGGAPGRHVFDDPTDEVMRESAEINRSWMDPADWQREYGYLFAGAAP